MQQDFYNESTDCVYICMSKSLNLFCFLFYTDYVYWGGNKTKRKKQKNSPSPSLQRK